MIPEEKNRKCLVAYLDTFVYTSQSGEHELRIRVGPDYLPVPEANCLSVECVESGSLGSHLAHVQSNIQT